MEDRTWLAITCVAIAEGIVFQFDPNLGWPLVLALFVAAIQDLLRRRDT